MPDGMAIELAGVGKRYLRGARAVPVLVDAALRVGPGEVLGIVGASGSGKSTLLHLLGLLDRPTVGRVLHDGRDMSEARPDVIEEFRNRHVGFVFQFHHLLPEFTAVENVMMPALIAGEPMRDARVVAEGLLSSVGLSERLSHTPGELSGGEQQRVAIARALVLRPRLVLADEPTGNLDPITGTAVQDLLLELNRERGTTLIVATHDRSLAARLPRVVQLWGGALAEVSA
jgi:lipoprotein-releasing system ATP-binding protein